jgi:hypothetical protein
MDRKVTTYFKELSKMENKKENRVIEFVKKHKGKVALAAISVAGVAVWAITKNKPSDYVDIDRPSLSTGEWAGLFTGIKGKFKGCTSGCATAVDVADLGKFGEALTTIEGISEHEPIQIAFGTERSFNK